MCQDANFNLVIFSDVFLIEVTTFEKLIRKTDPFPPGSVMFWFGEDFGSFPNIKRKFGSCA
jgi:hypothetical protein